MTLRISLLKRLRGINMIDKMHRLDEHFTDCFAVTEPRETDPLGQMFIIKKISKGKWEASYPDGSTKQFRTLKAASSYGIPKQFCQP